MTVKHDRNWVGSLMFFIFLLGSAALSTVIAFTKMISKYDFYEGGLVLPVGLALFWYLGWVLFDSSWLNFDEEEKEKCWKTSRWIKFLPIFLLPLVKLFKTKSGADTAHLIQMTLSFLLGYLSLCMPYGSGLGRLFQPFTIPRSQVYTDEKGQKFEVNFVGTTLSILLIIFPSWLSMSDPLGRIYSFIVGLNVSVLVTKMKFLSDTQEGKLIADIVVLVFILYSFVVMFMSCVKVTFFLNTSSMNYLKFAPIALTPIAILFADQLCSYGVNSYSVSKWVSALCYVVVSFVAYVSLISPPDSLTAVLFQPHVPMISTVNDLPEMKPTEELEKPRKAVVFPENENEKK